MFESIQRLLIVKIIIIIDNTYIAFRYYTLSAFYVLI